LTARSAEAKSGKGLSNLIRSRVHGGLQCFLGNMLACEGMPRSTLEDTDNVQGGQVVPGELENRSRACGSFKQATAALATSRTEIQLIGRSPVPKMRTVPLAASNPTIGLSQIS
jgi:hypothetical protein